MKSIFKRKSYIELPSFSSVTNEDVIFHIGAPKTGSTAIQKFCLENRETLKEHGLYYPNHGVDKNGISGGHSSLGQALIENRLDDAATILGNYVKEAKDDNCVLLLSAESIFYSPDSDIGENRFPSSGSLRNLMSSVRSYPIVVSPPSCQKKPSLSKRMVKPAMLSRCLKITSPSPYLLPSLSNLLAAAKALWPICMTGSKCGSTCERARPRVPPRIGQQETIG